MKCSCPKCSALLQEELSEIPEKGKNGKCSECSGSYWIHRESFILRCYAVAGARYCSNCGEELGLSTYCPGCGTLYPDYCIVHSKKPAQRAFTKKNFSLQLSLPGFAGKPASSGRKQVTISSGGKALSSDLRRQLLMVGVGLALVAALAVVALLYIRGRDENNFTRRYVFALYGIKSGTELCLQKSAILVNGNRLAETDIKLLKSVKTESDALMQILVPPPKKFTDSYNRLVSLDTTYKKLIDLCITPGASAQVASSAGALEAQFNTQAKELKATLTPELLEEITTKSIRYKNLQFLLK